MSSEIIYKGTKVQFIMELLLGSLQYNNLIFGHHLACGSKLWFVMGLILCACVAMERKALTVLVCVDCVLCRLGPLSLVLTLIHLSSAH